MRFFQDMGGVLCAIRASHDGREAVRVEDVEQGLARLSDISSAYSHLIGQWPAAPSTSTQVISYLVAFATFVGDPDGTTGSQDGAAPPSSQPGT